MKSDLSDRALYINEELNRERLSQLADSFMELSATFAGLPMKRDKLTSGQLDNIFENLGEKFCESCKNKDICWEKNYYTTYKSSYELLEQIDREGAITSEIYESEFALKCIASKDYIAETLNLFNKEQQNLKWNNRVISAREAVSEQLKGMAHIILKIKDEICLAKPLDFMTERNLKFMLRANRVSVKNIFEIDRKDQRKEIKLNVRARAGRCISVKEIASIVSSVLRLNMVPFRNTRNIINGEWYTLTLAEDANFKVLYGVSRKVKDNERVSGDNFSYIYNPENRGVICISDGMGSGFEACRESEKVIELLEQLTEAGFDKESSVKLINSLLVVNTDEPMFTTIDLCEIDLYSGICEFIKKGAAMSFIKHKNMVEAISSTSLPAGLCYDMDIEKVSKKLHDGDMIIMVTDGVTDIFKPKDSEEIISRLIAEINISNPKEFASMLLSRVLEFNDGIACDDMTVFVAGVWGK